MKKPKILALIILVLFLAVASSWLTHFYDTPIQVKTILDRHGNYLASFGTIEGGRQVWVEDFPQNLIQSLLQKEDRTFYYHPGFNPISLFKAALENLSQRRVVRGGSTITQQLAKNLIAFKEGERPSRNFLNKIREALLAVGLEARYSKDEILNRYLNTIYLGHRNYGFGAAALYYFGPAADRATLNAQAIDYLTSLPRSPNGLECPVGLCLDPSMAESYFDSKVGIHFAQYVAKQTTARVTKTSLDKSLQQKLEQAVQKILTIRVSEDPLLNTAAVVISVPTGEVLAMVGSRAWSADEADGQVNAAVALRQPGSTLKPFTYFAAFSKGYTPDSLVPDEPISFTTEGASVAPSTGQAVGASPSTLAEARWLTYPLAYMPLIFDRHFRGMVSIREALANSYNVPAVATLNEIGLSYYHSLLKKFGITSLNKSLFHYGLSVTLGSGEVSLLELTNAYATLARGGSYLAYQLTPSKLGQVSRVPIIADGDYYAGLITKILTDPMARVKTFGWNEDLLIEQEPVAVKTGTSYELRDNWTIGYTPDFAVGVWAGHNNGTPLLGTTGASGAGPIWHAVMEQVLKELPHVKKSNWLNSLPQNPLVNHRVSKLSAISKNEEPAKNSPPWRIISPLMNSSYRYNSGLPDETQKIMAQVRFVKEENQTKLKWFLNGNIMEEATGQKQTWLQPTLGQNILVVEDEKGTREKVFFQVSE